MDELIRRCNDFVWVHMYPKGQLTFGSIQHRDIVRTFFAGVFETLLVTKQHQFAGQLIAEYRVMTQENWIPDRRFAPPGVNNDSN